MNSPGNYLQGGVVVGPLFETGARAHVALRNGTKRTRQLHQRGVVVGPLFETGVCAHIWSLIVVDGAIIDVHSATLNVNASTL